MDQMISKFRRIPFNLLLERYFYQKISGELQQLLFTSLDKNVFFSRHCTFIIIS